MEAEHNLVSGSASMDIDEEYTFQPATKRSAMASAEQIKAEMVTGKAERVTARLGDRGRYRRVLAAPESETENKETLIF